MPPKKRKSKSKGLYANIHAKRKRIKAGSGEKMRKKEQKELLQKKHLKEVQKLQRKGRNNGNTCMAT